MTKQDVLQQCVVEGINVKLPDVQLDRKLYMDVAKSLNLIGGKWKGGKTMAFVFQEDPTELLAQVAGGEQVNLKKEYQFFATPPELAKELVELADISDHHQVLEPSAGQGAIVKAIADAVEGGMMVDCYELMPVNKTFLEKMGNVHLKGDDFLKPNGTGKKQYDRIVANPPFAKNQDIDHVMEMYRRLAPGGKLVTITSNHWEMSSNKKESNFRDFLFQVDAEQLAIDRGAFKSSGTTVGGTILVINN